MKKSEYHSLQDSIPATHNEVAETPPPAYTPISQQGGLADLQRYTSRLITESDQWGFANRKLKVRRHKLDDDTWQLTVVNPKTCKLILQAEGQGDTVLAHEDNLARMAEMLMTQGLTIRTEFEE